MHNQALRILTISSWAILLEFFVTTPSSAGLVKLAESGDSEPNGTNVFLQIGSSPVLSDNGQVVFYTDLRNNGNRPATPCGVRAGRRADLLI